MPGGVLFFWRADRETLDRSVLHPRAGLALQEPAGQPEKPLPFQGVAESQGRDADAGTALRRGQRGRQLRCPRGPGTERAVHLPIDERLRAVALGQTSRLAQYEIEVESPLRPKEIQARIRAGETAEEIADAAGIPVERVRWFEGPVLAERAYIADQAQAASVRRPGDPGPGPRLGDIVPRRLSAAGADPEDGQWDSRKRGDGNWQVSLTFSVRRPAARRRVGLRSRAAARHARRRQRRPAVAARVRAARRCPCQMPGEATVTPLAPRLGAVAVAGAEPAGRRREREWRRQHGWRFRGLPVPRRAPRGR